MLRRMLAGAFAAIATLAAAQPAPVLVDTDAGTDDLMAIAFLLAHPNVKIDAITVVNGLAHVDAGARNVARLLALAGRTDVPVFAGRGEPLRGMAEFPAEWRTISDELPGVTALPTAQRKTEVRPAADYLIDRLRQPNRPVRILALGPLTNLAEVLKREPSAVTAIEEIVIMGGALRVPGNLADGGLFKTSNKTAEWNMFIDPLAAQIVFRSGVKIRLIPLDATNTVPIGAEFLRDLESRARSPLGRFVGQVLKSDHEMIEQNLFYAWDPLAAAALLRPGIADSIPLRVEVVQDPPEQGRSIAAVGRPNARVALRADAAEFRRLFLDAFKQ
ncbi:MAG TPA: nucleoside hydrolase [Bryobacteraceae bacterium]|nr:nucleoside hydrolase [Bryobacteraceae bacterium]